MAAPSIHPTPDQISQKVASRPPATGPWNETGYWKRKGRRADLLQFCMKKGVNATMTDVAWKWIGATMKIVWGESVCVCVCVGGGERVIFNSWEPTFILSCVPPRAVSFERLRFLQSEGLCKKKKKIDTFGFLHRKEIFLDGGEFFS